MILGLMQRLVEIGGQSFLVSLVLASEGRIETEDKKLTS